ncbi:FAD-binding oxidoreductase [Microlunatus parietis]|uniref:FAD/FMN-containing dehydrogenase n=1 Tax=Microlunatus parietis TaxID=682979 RepID=A0A7Y9I4C3_9ACTN|nr:FAD-binding oxidoreductase [Microlunatus parietis]NYE70023.1 FAD/FMN-containing dehydrogenase [Microlunatus parietis]
MPGLSLDGAVFSPDSPGYDAARRPAHPAYRGVRPRLVAQCRSMSDVVRTLSYARGTGERFAIRSGGHCFAGRSSTDGVLLDLSGLDEVSVRRGIAGVGAGARLGRVYAALHESGRTLPAGCGPTVGIAGLTLGGGIGLLGRRYGLTSDRLVGARVVLADGSVVDCDPDCEPDLFWALRGAGGGQFGVVTTLRYETVPEPVMTRIEGTWSGVDPTALVAAWQDWAPDAPDELTVNLTLVSDPGRPVGITLVGAAALDEAATRTLLRDLLAPAGMPSAVVRLRGGLAYQRLKSTLTDPRDVPERVLRIRSEFFRRSLPPRLLGELLEGFGEQRAAGRRQLTFTAMGGTYNRVPAAATAFAHRAERFLLEHIGDPSDGWVDQSWATAHRGGSGRVYPNFPDPVLADAPAAYHAENRTRLAAIKRAYDPDGFFDVPRRS